MGEWGSGRVGEWGLGLGGNSGSSHNCRRGVDPDEDISGRGFWRGFRVGWRPRRGWPKNQGRTRRRRAVARCFPKHVWGRDQSTDRGAGKRCAGERLAERPGQRPKTSREATSVRADIFLCPVQGGCAQGEFEWGGGGRFGPVNQGRRAERVGVLSDRGRGTTWKSVNGGKKPTKTMLWRRVVLQRKFT